jgi:subtilase family serine protease
MPKGVFIMRRQIFMLVSVMLVSLSILAVVLTACATGPDLVPVKAPGNATFCEIDGGNLKVYVKNQGDADADGSEVEVIFYLSNGVQKTERAATGFISAGATDSVLVPMPDNCYNPDCNFKITVDIVNVVKESNETNNIVEGACIG